MGDGEDPRHFRYLVSHRLLPVSPHPPISHPRDSPEGGLPAHWTPPPPGAESLSCSANIFVGQTEAPLVIKPFIALLTMSECTFPGLASSSLLLGCRLTPHTTHTRHTHDTHTTHTRHTTHIRHTHHTTHTPPPAVHSVMASGFATVAGGVMVAYMSFGISPVHLIR
jgi:hypothetical protein